ncbi:MAG: inorganic pyrophosphatase [Anaerolineae bacterium]|jgi:inorganic pyrophosphatase|nr:inorganic pyrophosphatase [Anaerolineae bacterium]
MFPKAFYYWRPHPWHGLETGPKPPELVTAYIEITTFDSVKFEIDKITGYVRVDRPQRASSLPPTLYGFIPRTYCGRNVAALNPDTEMADGDPLDICVISERPINRGEILLTARVVGGIQLVDHGEADDKIIAVLSNDLVYKDIQESKDLPSVLVERLTHYFRTYKMVEGEEECTYVRELYNRERAQEVVNAAITDYTEFFGRIPS